MHEAGRTHHTMECESATEASSSLILYMTDTDALGAPVNKQVPAHFQSRSRFFTAKAGDGTTSPVLP